MHNIPQSFTNLFKGETKLQRMRSAQSPRSERTEKATD